MMGQRPESKDLRVWSERFDLRSLLGWQHIQIPVVWQKQGLSRSSTNQSVYPIYATHHSVQLAGTILSRMTLLEPVHGHPSNHRGMWRYYLSGRGNRSCHHYWMREECVEGTD